MQLKICAVAVCDVCGHEASFTRPIGEVDFNAKAAERFRAEGWFVDEVGDVYRCPKHFKPTPEKTIDE